MKTGAINDLIGKRFQVRYTPRFDKIEEEFCRSFKGVLVNINGMRLYFEDEKCGFNLIHADLLVTMREIKE